MSLIYETYEFDQNPDINDIKLLFEELNLYNYSETRKLIEILQRINCNFTIVSEFPYVDRNFRDSYYIYHLSFKEVIFTRTGLHKIINIQRKN